MNSNKADKITSTKNKDFKLFLFTCVKNGRPHIERLFNSLLKQTDTSFIHYIYDNGSSDPVDELVQNYQNHALELSHPFDIIYEKTEESIGLNLATKHCISKCSEPYFIWIDCDNWVDKDFVKELIKSIRKKPECFLYRTFLIRVDENNFELNSNYYERKLSLKTQNNGAFTFFTRKNKYYYSFFAVNTKLYFLASKNNILNIREYYNDEQVLSYCYLTQNKFCFVKRAIGFYLSRTNSEAHLVKPNNSFNEMFAYKERVQQAKKISVNSENYYFLINKMFLEYNHIYNLYNEGNIIEAREHFKELCFLTKKNNFSLKVTFRNNDFLYLFLRLFIYRRIKK